MLEIKKNIDLTPLNTLGVASRSEYFCSVRSKEELVESLKFARENCLPFYVFSGGSNVLLDDFLPGLLIKIELCGIEFSELDTSCVSVRAGAGENWHEFVKYTLRQGWYGLENLSLIPGSVGASPIQNIGAYGVELKDVCTRVIALNLQTGQDEVFDRESCRFAYRDSIFKDQNASKKYVILAVEFRLTKKFMPKLSYPALKELLEQGRGSRTQLTADDVSEAVIHLRRSKLPEPSEKPNAGSFFKNPVVNKEQIKGLLEIHPDMPFFEFHEAPGSGLSFKIPAAWLIERSGWKGRFLNKVGVHDQQALVLVNPDFRPLEEVMMLARTIRADVRKQFKISLEIEPQTLTKKQCMAFEV